ncbi:MAG: PIN domain-containing protein [Betaproteobacteria bacterium]
MTYVFDTSAFIVLKNFYPATFATLWSRIDALVANGSIASVQEVFNELHNYNDADFIQDWAKQHKVVFAKPSNAELLVVQKILAIPHFQVLIGNKAILKGTPVADPFVVAAAKIKGATVVTQEGLKPNAAKIPNVCEEFEVPCIDLQTFMTQQGWSF